jgi:hypothetical protein
MTKRLMRLILPLIILFSLVGSNAGCTYFSPLLGKWQDSQSSNTIEFTRDGNVVLNSNGYLTSGTYHLVGNDVVKLNLDGLSGDMASAFGVDTWQYTISGNTMTVVAGGSTDVFYRAGSSITPSVVKTTQQKIINVSMTLTSPKSGDVWHIGNTENITWKSSNWNGQVQLGLSYDSGNTWTHVISNPPFTGTNMDIPNTGKFQWVVSGSTSTHCRIEISIVDGTATNIPTGSALQYNIPAMSPSDFTITN